MPTCTLLYHATDLAKLDSIATEGMRGKSYWTNDSDILAYYEETVSDEGASAVALVIDLSDLDVDKIEPDFPGIEEPLTFTLGMSEDAVNLAWESSEKTWMSSLEIIKTVRYCTGIPAERIMVMDAAGVMHRLTDYAASVNVAAANGAVDIR